MLHKPAADGIDPIDVEIGLNLRRLRKARAMSQSDLAGKLGLTFQQVQKYERGANRISGSTLVRAARALGVQAADILPSTDATPLPTFAPLIASLRGAEEVMHGYAAIRSTKARYACSQPHPCLSRLLR